MNNAITAMALLLGLTVVTACTNTEPARLQQGVDAETTKDGLVKVDHSKLDLSYARPNVDWQKYTKLYFTPVKVTNDHPADYKPPRIDRRAEGLNATYDLPPEALEKMSAQFQTTVKDVFNSEQPFELVDKAGANTLVIEAAVTDIRLSAPIESSRRSYNSMGRTYTESSGSMMLLAVIKDGETGEVLAKAADRGQGFQQWRQNTQVFNWGDVKTVYRRWVNDFKNALMEAGAK
ncbi:MULTISPECIES: DUF3313 family protein [Shewanella]|uniref:DUF3313 family protein n=1 Tax=Shewanella fidelis TaxID=173509 RepID=A0AAW8NKR1_9GAMM|nr:MULTISPECIES: DUF3313 family protein [Shewanella]MDR8523360.1 DUF3313 family protein [Shewanella fidelis]MDW4813406.1 DUF3313 family protein [Shewanella fidelis]MDW4817222.1 DUF3313 family protein [Shewanella fidelis]MDW4821421.1 DUF3313 family protein [Shewanella fidelis]MDW4824501.1 DUF3313 family protein [Shewanella fidelis]